MNLLQRASKNIFWLFISEVGARGLIFVATLYLARVLGASSFGTYALFLAVGGYLWVLSDLGVGGYGLREVAKDGEKTQELLGSLNSMRMVSAVFIFFILSTALIFLDISPDKKTILLLGGLYILTNSISPDWVIIGLEKMRYLPMGKVAMSLSFLVAILLFVHSPSDIPAAMVSYLISTLLCGIVFLSILFWKLKISFIPNFNVAQWWTHLKESFFFYLGGNIGILGQSIPVFLLSILSTTSEIGIFSAPEKLTGVFFSLGNIVTLGIYPMLSSLYLKDNRAFYSLHNSYQSLVLFIGLPLGIGGMLLSNDIISLLFGQNYQASGDIMKVLVWIVPLSLLRLNYERTLLSANFQGLNLIALSNGMLMCLVLCLLLIPKYGAYGAAVGLIGGEAVTLFMMKLISSIKLNTARMFSQDSLKILIASIVTGVLLWAVHFHVIINIILGIICYGILVSVLGVMSVERILKVLKEKFA